MKTLDFEPIKTTEQFLENYKKHDTALAMVKSYFREHHFRVIDYGPDRRRERKWGDDRPDQLVWCNGYHLAFVDCKGHSGDKWMLNERAYYTYLAYSGRYKIPAFCIWANLINQLMSYAEIPFPNPKRESMNHDRNWVIKTESVQPIEDLIERLRILPFEEARQ